MAKKVKEDAQSTLMRQWVMLNNIRRSPRRVSAGKLQEVLRDRGYEIDIRTIQRDLNKLSEVLDLVGDGAKPQGWSWKEQAAPLMIPGIEPHTALAFRMAEEHLRQVLPTQVVSALQEWFSAASKVLDQHGNGLTRWPDKVRVLPQGLPRRTPQGNPAITQAIYEAVLYERQIDIAYQRHTAIPEIRRYRIHPLALVVRDNLIYLVCTFEGYHDLRQLLLNRIQEAQITEETSCRPEEFSLDDYIASGQFGLPFTEQKISLKAAFLRHVALHLQESSIADDQKIEELDKDRVLFEATLPNTLELRLWLKSFGHEVEILEPQALREEFTEMAQELANYYQETAG